MPVSTLLVEGALDRELLHAVFQGHPVVERGGSKNSLAPEVRRMRAKSKVNAAYLRDRDFDFDPAHDGSIPTVDRERVLGLAGPEPVPQVTLQSTLSTPSGVHLGRA